MAACRTRIDLVQYLDMNEYDETPLPMNLQDEGSCLTATPADQMLTDSNLGMAVVSKVPAILKETKTVRSVNKILQSAHRYGFLVKYRGEHVGFIGQTLTPLVSMESNNAACTKEGQMRVSACSPHAKHFRKKARMATTDKGTGNLPVEKQISRDRGAS